MSDKSSLASSCVERDVLTGAKDFLREARRRLRDIHGIKVEVSSRAERQSRYYPTFNSDLDSPIAQPVTLNVSGTLFTTRREVLLAVPGSYLSLLVAGLWESAETPQGSYFIDRNAKVFGFVLEHLRAKHVGEPEPELPDDLFTLRAIAREARFFQLPDLADYATALAQEKADVPGGPELVIATAASSAQREPWERERGAGPPAVGSGSAALPAGPGGSSEEGLHLLHAGVSGARGEGDRASSSGGSEDAAVAVGGLKCLFRSATSSGEVFSGEQMQELIQQLAKEMVELSQQGYMIKDITSGLVASRGHGRSLLDDSDDSDVEEPSSAARRTGTRLHVQVVMQAASRAGHRGFASAAASASDVDTAASDGEQSVEHEVGEERRSLEAGHVAQASDGWAGSLDGLHTEERSAEGGSVALEASFRNGWQGDEAGSLLLGSDQQLDLSEPGSDMGSVAASPQATSGSQAPARQQRVSAEPPPALPLVAAGGQVLYDPRSWIRPGLLKAPAAASTSSPLPLHHPHWLPPPHHYATPPPPASAGVGGLAGKAGSQRKKSKSRVARLWRRAAKWVGGSGAEAGEATRSQHQLLTGIRAAGSAPQPAAQDGRFHVVAAPGGMGQASYAPAQQLAPGLGWYTNPQYQAMIGHVPGQAGEFSPAPAARRS